MIDARIQINVDKELSNLVAGMASPRQNLAILRGGTRASAKLIGAAGKREAPRVSGRLAGSIRVGVKSRGDTVIGLVTAGARFKNVRGGRITRDVYKKTVGGVTTYDAVFYAGWVERGTKPHEIVASQGSALSIRGHLIHSVRHPGSRANPYMERAVSEAEPNLGFAFDEYLRSAIVRLQSGGDPP